MHTDFPIRLIASTGPHYHLYPEVEVFKICSGMLVGYFGLCDIVQSVNIIVLVDTNQAVFQSEQFLDADRTTLRGLLYNLWSLKLVILIRGGGGAYDYVGAIKCNHKVIFVQSIIQTAWKKWQIDFCWRRILQHIFSNVIAVIHRSLSIYTMITATSKVYPQ